MVKGGRSEILDFLYGRVNYRRAEGGSEYIALLILGLGLTFEGGWGL